MYSTPLFLVGTPSTRVGAQTQATSSFAPRASKRSCTCCHICTYSVFSFPFTPSAHGYQLPFISWSRRMAIGRPLATSASAQRVRYASKSPSMILLSS